ncbi:E3 ubiquitin/ISG15 ligase TRIM25-like [Dendropsophus ebraccatus]|uniref:E3 ubiquitin/ISG15 ligase TRIM25-like n=1 Tax=Dendropsophus ebraccatus TaxID=150705 RepID=UPI003831AEE4
MASADLRDELLCSICLDLYKDPVTLKCGHNFCRDCIHQALNAQDGAGVYSCPECRTEFRERPALIKNITLCNVAERFLSTQPHQEEITGICCTYCVDSPVPAVRSCLLCEASLCDKHLRYHSKSPEHVLTDPSTSLEKRKCSVHKKVLEYYCTDDDACICVSCSLAGDHRGHRVEMLDEASEKKKNKLRNVLRKLMTKREKTEERCKRLRKEATQSLSEVIQKLDIKKDELSRKMRHIEELCNMADPLTVLQDPDTGDLCDPEEGGGDEDTGGHDTTHGVDVDVITGMLHAGFSDIVTHLPTISSPKPETPLPTISPPKPKTMRSQPPGIQSWPSHVQASPVSGAQYGGHGVIVRTGGEGRMYGQGPADILLDINTANNNLLISDHMKTANWIEEMENRPVTTARFNYHPQVMSSWGFSSGRHYWDVEISRSGWWSVGMCYPSIDRRGEQSLIGCNNKSWSLDGGWACDNQCLVVHNGKRNPLPQISSDRVRICLDYEAGRLSFYELCDPIRHLHTFTTTFTEPLHAALCICDGSIKISGGEAAVRRRHHRGNLPRDR